MRRPSRPCTANQRLLRHGHLQRYSQSAISTILMLSLRFHLTLRPAHRFIDSILTLMKIPLRHPDYSCISKRTKSVNIPFKNPRAARLPSNDPAGLTVSGVREWKMNISSS
ncbi:transposase [Serratia fonticola]|uniref:transposase n=1 Tax=Serratia fonticola TaxID=47917 RepID=UPI003B218D1A|nr:hypothetical protein [Serratia fonticola]